MTTNQQTIIHTRLDLELHQAVSVNSLELAKSRFINAVKLVNSGSCTVSEAYTATA